MLNNNTYIVLKESNVKVFSNKNTNSLLKKKFKKKNQPKSQKTKDYIKKSNINPLLKIIYLYF
jgi:hypothetical protein